MSHESVSETPNGNVTPWISVEVIIGQFPIRLRFLKITTLRDGPSEEDHYISHDEAYQLAEALVKAADLAVDPSRRRPGVKP